MIRILIVDDHDLVRDGLRAILEADERFEVVGECGDGQEAIRLAGTCRPQVILMDVSMPGGLGGVEAAEAILRDHPDMKIIMLTQHENPEYIRRALKVGVHGYLVKRGAASQLKEAIDTVHRGERYLHPVAAQELVAIVSGGKTLESDDYDSLTVREKQVFKLLAEGKTSREIAKYLSISLKTAMTHRSHVMGKLNLHSRAELIRYAIRKSLISVDEN